MFSPTPTLVFRKCQIECETVVKLCIFFFVVLLFQARFPPSILMGKKLGANKLCQGRSLYLDVIFEILRTKVNQNGGRKNV